METLHRKAASFVRLDALIAGTQLGASIAFLPTFSGLTNSATPLAN